MDTLLATSAGSVSRMSLRAAAQLTQGFAWRQQAGCCARAPSVDDLVDGQQGQVEVLQHGLLLDSASARSQACQAGGCHS